MPLYEAQLRGTISAAEVFSHSLWLNATATEASDVATDVGAAWESQFAAQAAASWPDSTLWSTCYVSKVDLSTGVVLSTAQVDVTGVAGDSGNSLPPQCAIVCTLRTNLSGRSHRGRFYLPPAATGVVTNLGRLNSTAQANMADALQDFMTTVLGAGHTPVVYSRVLHATTVITALDVGDVFDTQRRRRDSLSETRQTRTF